MGLSLETDNRQSTSSKALFISAVENYKLRKDRKSPLLEKKLVGRLLVNYAQKKKTNKEK